MDRFDGNASLQLSDVLESDWYDESTSATDGMVESSTGVLARKGQVEALTMVLGDSVILDEDMLAKQRAVLGPTRLPPQPSHVEPDTWTARYANQDDFEMSSTTMLAQAGQNLALGAILDIDEDELIKQQAAARGTAHTRSSEARSPRSSAFVNLREQTGAKALRSGEQDEIVVATAQSHVNDDHISLIPGAFSMQGGNVVCQLQAGSLSDPSVTRRGSSNAFKVHDQNVGAALSGADEETAKKPDFSNLEVAAVTVMTEPPKKQSRKRIFWISILVLVLICAIAVGLGIGLSGKGSSTGEPPSPPETTDPCDFSTANPSPTIDTQCSCDNQISIVSEATQSRYLQLLSATNNTLINSTEYSCATESIALLRIAEDATVDIADIQSVTNRFALAILVEASGGIGDWPLSNWFSDSPVCEWASVGCNELEAITSLNLTNLFLRGYLPSQISLLAKLEVLDLSSNSKSGTIPTEIMTLPNLQALKLDGNNFLLLPTQIGMLQSLSELTITSSSIGGTIPTEVGNLTKLTTFDLSQSNIGGTIPTELGQLQSLSDLRLDGVFDLRGTIPTEIGNLSKLRELHLFNLDVEGNLPTELGLLQSLEVLVLASNRLGGEIPTEFGNLTALRRLFLGSNRDAVASSNRFSGELPTQLWNLSNLQLLDVGGQQFSGNITSEMFALPSLTVLRLRRNSFSGEIPNAAVNATQLDCLDVSLNSFVSGPIPAGICNNEELRIVVDCSGDREDMVKGCDCCRCGYEDGSYDPCDVTSAVL